VAPVMELRPFALTIPRATPVAVVDGIVSLKLAARPLPLRSRFLITFVLRDRSQSEFLPRRKHQVQYNSKSLLILGRILTKDKPHALHSGWPCGSRLQRGVEESGSACTGSVLLHQWGISHQWRHCLIHREQQRRLSPRQSLQHLAQEPQTSRPFPTWIVGVPACSDVPAPPEPFLLPTGPYTQGSRRCVGRPTSLPMRIFGSTSTQVYGVHIVSVPALAAEAAADSDVVVTSNPPNAWVERMLSIST